MSPPPRLAILIPVFRHAALVVETVEAALAQEAGFPIRIVLVNDGCPFPETHEACRDYALAWPERITYLRKRNGGLSDARNFGIRHVLENMPSVEAIYLMDADNLLRQGAMRRAMAELDAHPEADWIYPDIDMFGLPRHWDFGGDYSVLIHTAMNVSEAGSLIRRRVFEAGTMFDTGFKLGWEDWDFFLAAAQAGFRGRHLENFGFLYRKRPESMLADSERDQAALAGAMRLKHKAMLKPRALLAAEQREAPRYAIHLGDREVLYCVDPLSPDTRTVGYDQFEADHWRARLAPGRHRVPPFNVVMSPAVFEGLKQAGLLHWVLWLLETGLRDSQIVAISLQRAPDDRLSLREVGAAEASGARRNAAVLAASPNLLKEVIGDPRTDWIDTLATPEAKPAQRLFELGLPAWSELAGRQIRPTAVFDFLSLVHRLHDSLWRDALPHDWGFRENGIPRRNHEYEIVRQPFNHAPVFPRLADGNRHIGFLLPLVEFGGVEKVALHMARAMRAQGWVPHAVVLEARDAAFTPEWREVFESTSFLSGTPFAAWGGGAQDYLGTNVPQWAQHGPHAPALGMLHWLDAVINFHGGAGVALMGQLKRLGVITLDSLHLNDLSPFGRPVGNTYLGLAYEHAINLFVPCSNRLGDWLHGMGVPRDKIVPVPNAPGFELDARTVARSMADRAARPADAPLRVLFIGRLDRQKGLDHLVEVMRQTRAAGLDLAWRVIGKEVLKDSGSALSPDIAAMLEPPVARPSALAEAYGWADVMVLLSRYEGLPLTVLEAMRQGVVVAATDVGAVSEVLHHGGNGILLPAEGTVEACVDALRRLAKDRAELARLSGRAFADMENRTWAAAVAPLLSCLDRLIASPEDPGR